MEQVWSWVKVVAAAIGGGLAWMFGSWDSLIMVLVVFVALDYITGILGGITNKNLSSEVGFKGLIKKIGIFVIVAVAALLDKVVPAANGALRSATCVFFLANEGLSILENWAKVGLPLPDPIKNVLIQLKNKSDNKQEE